MRQWTHKEFCNMLESNDYHYDRNNGSHEIYINNNGHHISVPKNVSCVIAKRIIKENNLKIN